jgi:hypothetical protein
VSTPCPAIDLSRTSREASPAQSAAKRASSVEAEGSAGSNIQSSDTNRSYSQMRSSFLLRLKNSSGNSGPRLQQLEQMLQSERSRQMRSVNDKRPDWSNGTSTVVSAGSKTSPIVIREDTPAAALASRAVVAGMSSSSNNNNNDNCNSNDNNVHANSSKSSNLSSRGSVERDNEGMRPNEAGDSSHSNAKTLKIAHQAPKENCGPLLDAISPTAHPSHTTLSFRRKTPMVEPPGPRELGASGPAQPLRSAHCQQPFQTAGRLIVPTSLASEADPAPRPAPRVGDGTSPRSLPPTSVGAVREAMPISGKHSASFSLLTYWRSV